MDERAVVRELTRTASPPLVPEVRLRLAEEPFATWTATRADDPPFWAFAWAGGQVLARYVLDHPDVVAGRRVADIASGSGLVAIAAALAGAAHVTAFDVDPLARTAATENAALNDVVVEVVQADVTRTPGLHEALQTADVVLAGDVCYDPDMAPPMLAALRACAARGAKVLVGDPHRPYLPRGLASIAEYDVPETGNLEERDTTRAAVFVLRN
ncbi:class I SAM-dependent methyltransferase [Actinomadura rupiterrae]|uniref:class I SAM-dependent methyltransferase n=1 Tax=Actinomadura rupiterrae TaxID=559627 RepID=UPI0020A3F2C9|nr:50S ribosomal protein L11 methyltransferase [Actinomadura rupiterrae]MCP2340434.1 putative nicotinamide N-methyase [Actinomadura rupiterrae]